MTVHYGFSRKPKMLVFSCEGSIIVNLREVVMFVIHFKAKYDHDLFGQLPIRSLCKFPCTSNEMASRSSSFQAFLMRCAILLNKIRS